MSILSLTFIVFLFVLTTCYFLIPKRYQWIVLLVFSCVFYLSFEVKYILTIIFTSMSIFIATNCIENTKKQQKEQISHNKDLSRSDKKKIKEHFAKKRKAILIVTLIINFGLLAYFKYTPFIVQQANNIFSLFSQKELFEIPTIIAPLGISFYTFQTTGYLVDVYWDKYSAEKNPLKFFLFSSFFPQIIQGPINRFDLLNHQFYEPHYFDYQKFSYGCQRMLWGFLKKIIIADRLSPYVTDIFANYSQYSGITILLGAFCYSIQIYADFSGYMDIFCGFCEILDIKLFENFERPYFSKSIAEYWRRWHISLGAWFKDYLYFPIAFSKPAINCAKTTKKLFGAHIGKSTPAVLALILVWFTTGLWHGANWAYIAWGGINGFFIIFSMLLEPLYAKGKQFLRINENKTIWKVFQTMRTFFLVTLIKVFPEIGTFSGGCNYLKSIVTNLQIPTSISDIFIPEKKIMDTQLIIIGVIMMFIVSLIQRKGSVRNYLHNKPIVIRWGVYILILLTILTFGHSFSKGGFMYAQF